MISPAAGRLCKYLEAVQTVSLEFLSFAECGKLTFLCMLSVGREQVSHITDCLFADCVPRTLPNAVIELQKPMLKARILLKQLLAEVYDHCHCQQRWE